MIYPCSAIFFRASVSMICIALPLVAMIFLSAKAESVRIALLVVMLDISAISARLMLISILSFSSAQPRKLSSQRNVMLCYNTETSY